ncbi:MAG: bacitracin resistance protein BacA [Leptospiraceae bacterium]|nr:bacitracin resistance protein BacA [Leptospiraceae bacterium]MDW7975102.1 bacitracin resistance protein BacA [Leptospiraceae bacterium]
MREVYVPPSGPPKKAPPELYSILKEDGIRKLLWLHYKNLSQSKISFLFPRNEQELLKSAEKNADFFIQVLGGPPLFTQKYGPPMMRARHMKFPITYEHRNVWLECFFLAIEEIKKEIPLEENQEKEFKEFLEDFSEWMVNTKD